MRFPKPLHRRMQDWHRDLPRRIAALRLRLVEVDTVPQLAVLGILVGLLAGGVIIGFRLTIESAQSSFLPGAVPENYESLEPVLRLLLPVGGGLIIGLLWHHLPATMARVGVVHVMERLAHHQARLPMMNAVLQFVGASLAIVSGQSVGREGPGIHLGATAGSQLGQWIGLPNNSIRTLVGCGVAAAIGAGFNTPLAGVILAMEVVMMEYTLAGFAPVILAAVSATALTRWVFGSAPAFAVPPLDMGSVLELPVVLGAGILIGALAAIFIRVLEWTSRYSQPLPRWLRPLLGGVVVGLCALGFPQVMGVGYDTVSGALVGDLGLGILLGVALFKLLATAVGLGLGLPGGLIGPTLVIGATAGGTIGLLAADWLPGEVSSAGFYAMIGMGAMMGATLQAPLAALMAMLELTANPNILLPGMLAVITAGMVNSELFRQTSVYLMIMRTLGLDYRNDPVSQSLRRVGVARFMNTRFVTAPRRLEVAQAQSLLARKPLWIVIEEEGKPVALLPAADLARQFEPQEDSEAAAPTSLDLMEIPGKRQELAYTHLQATLQEAWETLRENKVDALYVTHAATSNARVYGVLTRKDIEETYAVGSS